jgi:UDP-2,3-diacylglucosamine pyrophosphatase LpxH
MKFAIISDTHFGDPDCSLVQAAGDGAQPEIGEKYRDFAAAAGTENDYLIVLGDIFDFSIRSYAEVYAAGKVFFERVRDDHIASQIIYVPGNHDFAFWHLVEYEVNVLRRMKLGKMPRDFRFSVPGVLDDRAESESRGFRLPHVSRNDDESKRYGGLALDAIAPGLTFNVAYPNLYFVNAEHSILITHGHYLENYWQFASEVMPKIAGEDLECADPMSLKDLVALNFPLNQLASSGVGQAGALTSFIRRFQGEVRDGQLGNVERWVDNLDRKVIDPKLRWPLGCLDPREWISDLLLRGLKRFGMKKLGAVDETRYSSEFERDPEVQSRFERFYRASLRELHLMNQNAEHTKAAPIPDPLHLIWGHTHRPRPWGDESFAPEVDGKPIAFHNTGGWLFSRPQGGPRQFHGAEVFVYEDGKMRSTRIE